MKSQTIELNLINDSIFGKYDIIFIGEQHNIASNDSIEAFLTLKLASNATKVLLELGYDQNYVLNNFFTKKDTTTINLLSPNVSGSALSGVLYNLKITPKAIDILTKENFSKELVLKAYSTKETPIQVKNDIKEFSEIGMMRSPHVVKNMNKYDHFLENYRKNQALHMKYLGADSIKIVEYFESLKASIESACDPNASIDLSNFREDFMYKMVEKEIHKNVISINGHSHICLDPKFKDKRIKNKKWSPLAYKVKTKFPDKKVCSIYLLNIKKDIYFAEDYPDELKYIVKNIEANKRYIIKLDYPNSPFKALQSKYTFIVVY
ncbi:MAG: hypothetical protein Q7W45_09910 [Bacteroidota bacterium]|nr:hypothetical protein [Bacteroidota bacterium]MDP3143786.1 hypothetical protein [Bacteroidota bacterium]